MAAWFTWRSRLPVLPGLLLAVLSLVSQLALGAMVLPDAGVPGQPAGLDAVAVLCLAGAPQHPGRDRPHQRRPDIAPPSLAAALALPAILPIATSPLPQPRTGQRLRLMQASVSACAPPSHASFVGLPRGPPVPV